MMFEASVEGGGLGVFGVEGGVGVAMLAVDAMGIVLEGVGGGSAVRVDAGIGDGGGGQECGADGDGGDEDLQGGHNQFSELRFLWRTFFRPTATRRRVSLTSLFSKGVLRISDFHFKVHERNFRRRCQLSRKVRRNEA